MSTDWPAGSKTGMFSAYLNAYDQGRELARRRHRGEATALFPAPDSQAQPVGFDAHHVSILDLMGRLPDAMVSGTSDRADALAAVVHGVAQHPYSERRTIMAHLAPHLGQFGFMPSDVSRFDPTDANLAVVLSTAQHVHRSAARGRDPTDADASTTSPEPASR